MDTTIIKANKGLMGGYKAAGDTEDYTHVILPYEAYRALQDKIETMEQEIRTLRAKNRQQQEEYGRSFANREKNEQIAIRNEPGRNAAGSKKPKGCRYCCGGQKRKSFADHARESQCSQGAVPQKRAIRLPASKPGSVQLFGQREWLDEKKKCLEAAATVAILHLPGLCIGSILHLQ